MAKVIIAISEDICTREELLRGSKGDSAGKNVLPALDRGISQGKNSLRSRQEFT
jgi:hypothetical protein